MEYSLVSEEFGTSLDGYDSFSNGDEEGTVEGDPTEEEYQGIPDPPEIDDIMDKVMKKRHATVMANPLGLKLRYLIIRR